MRGRGLLCLDNNPVGHATGVRLSDALPGQPRADVYLAERAIVPHALRDAVFGVEEALQFAFAQAQRAVTGAVATRAEAKFGEFEPLSPGAPSARTGRAREELTELPGNSRRAQLDRQLRCKRLEARRGRAALRCGTGDMFYW